MQQNLLWLSTSLFCSKSHWNTLLSDGIKPFLNSMPNKKELTSFQLEFNSLHGENIRLSLLTQAEKAETLAKKADSYFKNFFSIFNLSANEPDLTNSGIFMPIPSNTIQYGLYKTESITDKKLNYFQKELSLIIIEGLRKENIDQETIITFAFYMHMALIKLIKDKHAVTTKEFLQWYHAPAFNVTDEKIDMEFIKAKYEANKEVLLEIADDIMKHPSFEEVPYWLERWMTSCEEELILYNGKDEYKELYETHNRITFLIKKHLGIIQQMKLLLYYFIKQVISTSFDGRGNKRFID